MRVPPGSRVPSETWACRSSLLRLRGFVPGCRSGLWSPSSSSENRASWRGCFQDSPVTSCPLQQHVLLGQAKSFLLTRDSAVALSCPQTPVKEDSAGASGLLRWPLGTRLGLWQAMGTATHLAMVLSRPEPGGSCRRWQRVSYPLLWRWHRGPAPLPEACKEHITVYPASKMESQPHPVHSDGHSHLSAWMFGQTLTWVCLRGASG